MHIPDHKLNAEYKPAEKSHWEGRKSNLNIEHQYWHQEIQCFDVDKDNNLAEIDIAILAYECDEGVRRNRGRIGSCLGPNSIRERLAKLPLHFDNIRIADVGNIVCIDDDMEAAQLLFAKHISNLIQQNILPIGIGGGHDMAYGHFLGIKDALRLKSNQKIGIINFDAHFDLRPVEDKANSGTPFNQILNTPLENGNAVDYFAIGIQQQSNTKELFNIAQNTPINYAINYDCESSKVELEALKQRLLPFIEKSDYLYVTIDLDGFSSAYAPGVSAPSPLGFTPYFVFKMLSFLFGTEKIIAFDIAELNPSLDRDKLTANLAAKIIDYVVMNYHSPSK